MKIKTDLERSCMFSSVEVWSHGDAEQKEDARKDHQRQRIIGTSAEEDGAECQGHAGAEIKARLHRPAHQKHTLSIIRLRLAGRVSLLEMSLKPLVQVFSVECNH